ncbi:S-adenosyl-L-methionine-dependent methyltransferase [Talaromyces proteolyticus]|uniref:S-adenosyl-L-methionine-dependent methyltransferase n=1 Tax=Talaromyces proteolyticus TaxID=1131652 RepID=A0AAD4L1R3_9EURO|nr:S-adenosyl-L-methionine-dependent methyltransferase [Talaromyces proteolyticus]KAH8705554.1 S-adenosyl-L-methionine-dependent methyltransferase [Talaromyces proteolyticus]
MTIGADRDDSDVSSIFSARSTTTAPTEWSGRDGTNTETDSDMMSLMSSMYDSTHSISSSVLNYHFENGRRYHAYHEGKYIMPNDVQEQNKLMLVHLCYELVFDGRLHLAPINNPQNALDIGTGRGDWAIDFAERYPSTQVIGIDLSPIQPLWVPPNLTFEIDDAEDDWVYSTQFDYIHTRTLCGGIRDWPQFHKRAFDNLRPGGWLEMQENDAWFQCEDGTCPKWTKIFLEKLDEASIMSGNRLNVAADQKQHMINAGFANVHDDIFKLPLSTWHDDPRWKEIGQIRGLAMNQGVEGYSLALYTRYLGWTSAQVHDLLAKVRGEFNDVNNRMYIAVHVVYGQKLEESVQA